MTDVNTIASRYIDLWNERTPSRRREILGEHWAKDAKYVDPLMSGDGHDGVDALIAGVQQRFPDFRFKLRSRKAPDESECDCPGSPGVIDRTVAQSKPCHPVAGCDLEHVVALGAELPRHQRKLPLPGCNRFSGFKRCGLAAEQDRCWRLTQRSHA